MQGFITKTEHSECCAISKQQETTPADEIRLVKLFIKLNTGVWTNGIPDYDDIKFKYAVKKAKEFFCT